MFRIFVTTIIMTLAIPNIALARIDILPKKVVIQERQKSGEFSILNLYDVVGNFRIEIVSYKQDENGVYQKLDTFLNPNFDPKKVIRFSPRQFTLEPGERQKVRLLVRKPANLDDGEYRFHVKAIRFVNDDLRRNNTGAVSLLMNMGVTIPVIVRHGKIYSDAKIQNTQLNISETDSKPELEVNISREGNSSTIGKLDVIWQSQEGDEKSLGMVSNANIFTEINNRKFIVPLQEIPKNNGHFLVRYSDEVKEGKVFDEVVIKP